MAYLPQLLALASVIPLAAISPGPDFVAVSSHALSSRAAGVRVAIGIALGCLTWAALAMFGIGLLLLQTVWLYEAIRLAGAAYLLWLGARMVWSARQQTAAAPMEARETGQGSLVLRGYLVGLTNPKAAAFFGSLFVTLLPADAPLWVQGATLGIVLAVSGAWFSALAIMLSTGRVRAAYTRVRRPVDALLGAVLMGLGVRLAV